MSPIVGNHNALEQGFPNPWSAAYYLAMACSEPGWHACAQFNLCEQQAGAHMCNSAYISCEPVSFSPPPLGLQAVKIEYRSTRRSDMFLATFFFHFSWWEVVVKKIVLPFSVKWKSLMSYHWCTLSSTPWLNCLTAFLCISCPFFSADFVNC